MRPITFHVEGQPVPQPRVRVSSAGGFARAYVPAKHPVHAYRKAIEAAARQAGVMPAIDPVDVIVMAQFERPKSHMTKKGVKATAPRLPRPDVDNVGKAILDALQPVIGDDTIVARLVVAKRYSDAGMTSVTISEMSDE
jgi:Holliday junction resolvase RusA-like endonuclease